MSSGRGELLTHLSVTDDQEFVPILQAVTGHKDVITKKAFVEGVLSEIAEEIREKNLDLEAVTSGARTVEDQDEVADRIKDEIRALEDKRKSHGNQPSLKQTTFSSMSCFTQHQATPTSWFIAS